MNFFFHLCKFLQRRTLNWFCDFEKSGVENVPPFGPLIVVSNHMSDIDPSILAVTIKRRLWFLCKYEAFRTFAKRRFLYAYGAFPINREKADFAALKWGVKKLKSNEVLVLFPEGHINYGQMIKAKQGVVRIIQMTDATILPVAITGTERFEHNVMSIFKPTGKITCTIGSPFSLPKIEGKITPEVMDSLNEIIMERIANLLPDKYRGVYNISDK